MTVNAQFVQEHFDEFIAAVETGETVEVTRDGKAPLRLVLAPSVQEGQVEREWTAPRFGMGRGKVWLAPDWDSPETNAEIPATFYESDIRELGSPEVADQDEAGSTDQEPSRE